MDTTTETNGKLENFTEITEIKEIIEEIEKLPAPQKMQALGYIQGVAASISSEDAS